MSFKLNSPGNASVFSSCGCCSTTCTGGMSGTIFGGCGGDYTVTATGPGGAVTVTDSAGTISLDKSQGAGTYTITISGTNVYTRTASVTWGGCGTSASFGTFYLRDKSKVVTVGAACGNFASTGVDGATVTFTGSQTGTATVSGVHATTVTVSLSDDGANTAQSGTLTMSMDRYVDTVLTFSGGISCSPSIALSTTTDCYVCCSYPYPMSGRFHFTSPLGSIDIDNGSGPWDIVANVVAHAPSSLPTCPATPSCCGGTSGGLCNCGGTPTTTNDVTFRVLTDCVPNTTLFFIACASVYPHASADFRNGFSAGANVLWDYSTLTYSNGGFAISGTNCSEPSIGSWAGYYDGSYTLSEIGCVGGLSVGTAQHPGIPSPTLTEDQLVVEAAAPPPPPPAPAPAPTKPSGCNCGPRPKLDRDRPKN